MTDGPVLSSSAMDASVSSKSSQAEWLGGCARFVLHLRLTFNYVLAPLFVWGSFASGVLPDWRFWLGFAAFHVFLYGGTNMFNSYYDRDEGPIGGLEHPPPVDSGLLFGSLALKIVGLALAFLVGVPFVVCYVLFMLYSVSYSHPAIRIKRRPVASAVTVFVGQGIVGFAAGWFASGGTLEALAEPTALVAGLGGALLVSAIYPLTQIYQLEEDRRRSDMTLARWLGLDSSLRYSLILLSVGAACVGLVFWRKGFRLECGLLAVYFVGVLAYLWQLGQVVRALDSRAIYRRIMRFNYVNSSVMLLVLGVTGGMLWQR
ncbi:MAG: UbiA prenyltransferase family protein [Planctomycetes bacterium]|nr:UbiA prenyltransferase family protein [Planctomycetota bacterium]